MLIDADDAQSMEVVLDHRKLEVPVVCRTTTSRPVASSPCLPDEPLPTQRYRFEGRLVYDPKHVRFVATRIDADVSTPRHDAP